MDENPWEQEDPEDEFDREHRAASSAPTPGERLLYALGQLYLLSRRGELRVAPANFDVWDLAGIIGVRGDIEFISEDRSGSRWHFAGEVLLVDLHQEFPWRLLSMWEWADEAEGDSDRGDAP